MQVKFISVEITTMCHATEELEKVLQCLKNLIPFEFEHEVQRTYGHFKNPIDVITAKIGNQKEIQTFLKSLGKQLSAKDRADVLREFEKHFGEGRLHLRFDKMRAFFGEAALGDGIYVTISATSYPYDEKSVKRALREVFEGGEQPDNDISRNAI